MHFARLPSLLGSTTVEGRMSVDRDSASPPATANGPRGCVEALAALRRGEPITSAEWACLDAAVDQAAQMQSQRKAAAGKSAEARKIAAADWQNKIAPAVDHILYELSDRDPLTNSKIIERLKTRGAYPTGIAERTVRAYLALYRQRKRFGCERRCLPEV